MEGAVNLLEEETMDVHTNWLAVIVAALAHFFLGWAWHSKLLFMKTWAKEMGMEKMSKKEQQENMKKMPVSMAGNFAALIVTGWVLSYVIVFSSAYYKITGIQAGIQSAIWIWLGFYATTALNMVFWEGRSWKLYFINTSYHLAGLLLMGGIIASWM